MLRWSPLAWPSARDTEAATEDASTTRPPGRGGRAGALDDAGDGRAGRARPACGWPLDRSQFLAGLLLGVAATARLPLVFAAPWLMLVGGGGSRLRRAVSAGRAA